MYLLSFCDEFSHLAFHSLFIWLGFLLISFQFGETVNYAIYSDSSRDRMSVSSNALTKAGLRGFFAFISCGIIISCRLIIVQIMHLIFTFKYSFLFCYSYSIAAAKIENFQKIIIISLEFSFFRERIAKNNKNLSVFMFNVFKR